MQQETELLLDNQSDTSIVCRQRTLHVQIFWLWMLPMMCLRF